MISQDAPAQVADEGVGETTGQASLLSVKPNSRGGGRVNRSSPWRTASGLDPLASRRRLRFVAVSSQNLNRRRGVNPWRRFLWR